MDNLGNLLLPLCGFGVVCCGGLGLLLFIVYRFAGRTLLFPAFEALSSVFERGMGGDDDETDLENRRSPRSASPDQRLNPTERLRSRIQAADDAFEQALRNEGAGTPGQNNDPRAGTRPVDLGGTERWQSTLERRRRSMGLPPDDEDNPPSSSSLRRRRRERQDDEEVWGGAFDENHNDIPDMFE